MLSVINPVTTLFTQPQIYGQESWSNKQWENYSKSYYAPVQPQLRQPVKDFSKPLFVDCSIEYELPNAPAVPKNSDPILMIHPAYKTIPTKLCRKPSCSCSTSIPSVSKSKTNNKRSYNESIRESQSLIIAQQQQQRAVRMQQEAQAVYERALTYEPSMKRSRMLNHHQNIALRKQQQMIQLQQQNGYVWPLHYQHQQQAYVPSSWPSRDTELQFYKNQQEAAYLKFFRNSPYCAGCATGRCPQMAWNKENLDYMRSL